MRENTLKMLHIEEQLSKQWSKFLKLSFLQHLFHLKSIHGLSIKSFDMLIELLFTSFAQINPFPSAWSKYKELKNDFRLYYGKIHACPNDCVLYWDGRKNQDEFNKCHTSQWRDKEKKLSHNVLHYFFPYSKATVDVQVL